MSIKQLRKATSFPDFDADIRPAGQGPRGGANLQQFTFATPFGRRRAAYLVRPHAKADSQPVILFVHWYESEAHNSNREQFLDEALALGERGAICLLIETMWSDRDWFIKRSQEEDYSASLEQTAELRLAMDILLNQPGADPQRFAYVGHDFGGMYGVLAGAIDPRPTSFVIMAATPRFPDWYLYYPPLEGQPRQDFIAQMAALDPIEHIASLSPRPVFFQFGEEDPHVPRERAETFIAPAGQPHKFGWYPCGHFLNEHARDERTAWLADQLDLP